MLQTSTERVQKLMEIGFIAAGNGMLAEAETIFTGIQAVRPESELPLVGRAFVRMNSRQFREAVAILQQAMQINPDSDLAMSFLGASLQMLGMNQQSREVLQQVVDADNHDQAVAFANALLESPN